MSAGAVVVTGASGFVGSALCERLRELGRPMIGTVRKVKPGMPGDLQPVGDLAAADDDALDELCAGAVAVVHLAGRAHVMREREPDPERAFRLANVEATARLARAAVRSGVRRFVLASSVKVSGETSRPGRPLRPDDPPRPQDAYARSKLAAERALCDAAAGSAMEAVVLRLPLVYGRSAVGNFARLAKAVAQGKTLPVASIHNRRSLLYVGNLVDAIVAVLDAPQASGVHFVADAEAVSTPDLVRAIATASGVRPRMVAMPVSLLRLAGLVTGRSGAIDRLAGSLEVDTSRFREATGWTPRYSLDAALARSTRLRPTDRR
ncbi:MAG TPA: NAD-dependent epimerase/dehydratase family protein [Casimicrobiaceae bacterium]|nr:NAD-dependent epimerase/dehydratase family protein [Casimicrobiaceae bacterium]